MFQKLIYILQVIWSFIFHDGHFKWILYHTHTLYISVCVCVILHLSIYLGKTGNKSNSIKIYRNEKTQGLQRILFIEFFA